MITVPVQVLVPDDLRAGEFVTVFSGKSSQMVYPQSGMVVSAEIGTELKGQVLSVQAVDLPYVLACIVPSGRPVIIDSRVMRLMRCDPNYANMMELVCKTGRAVPEDGQRVQIVGDGETEVRA